MIDSDDSQLMPLSFVATSVSMSLSSCSRNIKGQFGTLFFSDRNFSGTSHVSRCEACKFNFPRKSRQCDDLRTLISKFLILPFLPREKVKNYNKFLYACWSFKTYRDRNITCKSEFLLKILPCCLISSFSLEESILPTISIGSR